jgi:hypothetical protein
VQPHGKALRRVSQDLDPVDDGVDLEAEATVNGAK